MDITESERLVLREFEESDETALLNIWGSAEVMKHCGGAARMDIIRKVIRIDRENFQRVGYAVFAVVEKNSRELVGAVGCKPSAENPRRGELIYHFCVTAWGKGYGSEAVAAYLRWAEETKCMEYVFASALPENTASIRILEKSGFVQNGFVQFKDTGFVPEPFYELNLTHSG